MFSCSACTRRAISSLSADLPPLPSSLIFLPPTLRQSLYLPTPPYISHRSSSTIRGLSKGHHRKLLLQAFKSRGPLPESLRRNAGKLTPVETRDRRARENNATHLATPSHLAELREKAAIEATYLVDPVRLAAEVRRQLSEHGDFEKAIALVRASEKQGLKDGKGPGKVHNVVSWNHIIDHSMAHGDTKTALKTYNEMKKRGHKPDAHTYTIMLRGFGSNVRKAGAVEDAMKVYNSMYDPGSQVKPNTIHHNAMIYVCARGGDMDAMWSVAGRLPQRGVGESDHVTYTIILKTLEREAINEAAKVMARRLDLGKPVPREDDDEELEAPRVDEVAQVFENAVEDGRKLWREVIIKWRKANLKLDETLVCSMGRLLLLGKKRKDMLDVLRLVEQTMNVPMPLSAKQVDPQASLDSKVQVKELVVFDPAPPPDPKNASPISYVPLGRNTLSMILEACLLARLPDVGTHYWNTLTDTRQGQFALVPDGNNITAFIRLLRFSRSSQQIVDLLAKDDWPEDITAEIRRRGSYVIAMSACVRDKWNPSIFSIASRLVDLMQEHTRQARAAAGYEEAAVEGANDDGYEDIDENVIDASGLTPEASLLDADPKVLAMYLNLAMYTTPTFAHKGPARSSPGRRDKMPETQDENNILQALKKIGPDIVNVARLLKIKLNEIQTRRQIETRMRSLRQREMSAQDKQTLQNIERSLEGLDDLVGFARAVVASVGKVLRLDAGLKMRGKESYGPQVYRDMNLKKKSLEWLLGRMDLVLDPENAKGRGVSRSIKIKQDGDEEIAREEKSGVWEAYNPESRRDDYRDEGREEVVNDTFVMRTTSQAKVEKARKRETKILNAQRAWATRKRLSRRQTQEEEKERRETREQKLREYDIKSRLGRIEPKTRDRGFGVGVGRKERLAERENTGRWIYHRAGEQQEAAVGAA
jgi:pentatricopeptide repeat protein